MASKTCFECSARVETSSFTISQMEKTILCSFSCFIFLSCSGLSSPLQILAAQASSSPPVLVSRQPSAETLAGQPGEPQAKRPKMEDEGGPEAAQHQATPGQQPVIVAMASQTHDARQ